MRLHNGPADVLEFQYADQPATDLGGPHDLLVIVVEYAAVAEQRTPLWDGDNIAKWRNPIL
jgi:hypothetical protein